MIIDSLASIFWVELSEMMKLCFFSSSRKEFFSFCAESSLIPETSSLGVSMAE